MSLEQWSKISDIIFKGILASAIAVGTLILAWEKNTGDTVRQCDTLYATLVDYASKTKFDDRVKQHITFRISSYNQICTPKLDDTQVQNIINMLGVPPTQTAEAAVDPGLTAPSSLPPASLPPASLPPAMSRPQESTIDSTTGWVALSRIPASQYADVNFDTVVGKGKFEVGDLLKSRWTVNIRQKNTPVSRGDNPILGILDAGACVKVEEYVAGQLNKWGRITQAQCTP